LRQVHEKIQTNYGADDNRHAVVKAMTMTMTSD